MYLLNFEHWMSTVFVDAVGATFAHSLWQALIALIASHIVLSVSKKSSPAVRYNLLVGIATLLAGAVLVTFILQFNSTSSSKQLLVTYVPFQQIINEQGNEAMPAVMQYQYVLNLLNNFLNRYMDVLVAVWFVVACYKWLRLSVGLSYIKRIARFESSPADFAWLQKFEALKSKLGITGKVALLQSNIIKVPIASGLLKPMIIVPASLFANMTPELIESILLHELAHIRRKDFLVNILQSFAETIFFFNPFIIKISSLIRDERENCCDAMAVDIVKDKLSYVEALVAFGEYSTRSTLAVAFAGKKNSLLQRVKRILYNQNKKPGVMEKSILAFGVILFLGLAIFSTVNGTEKILQSKFAQALQEPVVDTVPITDKPTKREVKRAQRVIEKRQEKVERKQKELQDAVEDMEKDVKKYHEAMGDELEIANTPELNDLIEENDVNIQNDVNLKFNADVQNLKALNQIQFEKIQKDVQVQMDKIRPVIDQKIKVHLKAQKELNDARAVEMRAQHDLAIAGKLDQLKQKQLMQMQQQQFQLQNKIFDSLNKTIQFESDNLNLNTITFGSTTGHNEMNEVLQFLEKNNVAKASDIMMVTLNETELIVNDKKQPASLHEQLKKKYLNKPGDHMSYLRKGESIMISTQIHEQDPI